MKKLVTLMLASAIFASPCLHAVTLRKRRNFEPKRAVVALQEGQEQHNILPPLPQQLPTVPVQPATIWDVIDNAMAASVGVSAAYGIGYSLTSYISTATSQLIGSAIQEDIALTDTLYAPEPSIVISTASALCAAWYLGKSLFNTPYSPYSQQERSADRFLGFGSLGVALLSGAAAQGLI